MMLGAVAGLVVIGMIAVAGTGRWWGQKNSASTPAPGNSAIVAQATSVATSVSYSPPATKMPSSTPRPTPPPAPTSTTVPEPTATPTRRAVTTADLAGVWLTINSTDVQSMGKRFALTERDDGMLLREPLDEPTPDPTVTGVEEVDLLLELQRAGERKFTGRLIAVSRSTGEGVLYIPLRAELSADLQELTLVETWDDGENENVSRRQ